MVLRIPVRPAISDQTAGNARIIGRPMDGLRSFFDYTISFKISIFFLNKSELLKAVADHKQTPSAAVGAGKL
jgi:hypothetical protein